MNNNKELILSMFFLHLFVLLIRPRIWNESDSDLQTVDLLKTEAAPDVSVWTDPPHPHISLKEHWVQFQATAEEMYNSSETIVALLK